MTSFVYLCKILVNYLSSLNRDLKLRIKFLKKELIRPTKIYSKELSIINEKNLINGCANITGGGLADNLKRIIPKNLSAEINLNNIKTLKIFKWLHKMGITENEMLKTFNCGVGFCLVINPKNLSKIIRYFGRSGLVQN